MRIAQVAPLMESVPPKLYGGTERVVSYLTEALVEAGHEVTLFASGDSQTKANFSPICPEALRLAQHVNDPLAYHTLLVERVLERADDFDVMHFHLDYLHLPGARRTRTPSLTTLHGRLDLPDIAPVFHQFRDASFTSISDDQRRPLPQLRWEKTVYHGLPRTLHHARLEAGSYLAFVGRISPEKGADSAIRIAQQVGLPLKVGAKVDKVDREYYQTTIEPLLTTTGVEFLGEVNEEQKGDLLGGAMALLFPINWPEPFGLVMIEAMACGTPVIAFRRGSVPEIIEEGVTGFVVDTVEQAIEATKKAVTLSRARIREAFEKRFTAARMAHDYVDVYKSLVANAAQQVMLPGRTAPGLSLAHIRPSILGGHD